MTNKAVREFAKNQFPKNPAIAKKLGVKVKQELHLDPDHQAFILFRRPTPRLSEIISYRVATRTSRASASIS